MATSPTPANNKELSAAGHGRVARAWNDEEEDDDNDADWHDASSNASLAAADTTREPTTLRCRPLGGFEQFMYKAHQMGCGLIYMIAELHQGPKGKGKSGPPMPVLPNSHLIEQALRPIIARHPNLRARISADGQRLEVLPMEDVSPAAWVVPFIMDCSEGAVGFVKEELKRTPIALGRSDGPFWQLFLVQEKEEEKEGGKGGEGQVKQSLVAFAHHSIMDGESLVLFLKEVVGTTEKLLRQATITSKSNSSSDAVQERQLSALPLEFLPSQDELYETILPPMPGDGPRGALAFLWRRVTWLLKRPTVPAPEAITNSLSLRSTHILSSSRLQGPFLLRLLHRCHAEHTTIAAVLAAATMLELKRLMPESSTVNLKMETMVNLRKALCKEDADRFKCALQCLAAPIDTVVSVSDEDDLWGHARRYKEGLTEAMKAGQWKRQVAAFHAFKYGIYEALARVAVSPRMQGRVKAAAISNLGVLGDEEEKEEEGGREEGEGGPLRIARLQWGISLHGIGQYVFVAASTQGGSLNVAITCASPMVSAARAQGLLDGIVGRLTLTE